MLFEICCDNNVKIEIDSIKILKKLIVQDGKNFICKGKIIATFEDKRTADNVFEKIISAFNSNEDYFKMPKAVNNID